MADLTREDLQRLARLGAQARLQDLRQEEVMIRRAFPELFRAGTSPVSLVSRSAESESAAPATRRRPSGMSAAARREVSERMKRYWAERRKAKGAKNGK